jgi:hypothetical protein
MTRISSPYKVVKNAVVAMFEEMQWNHSAYLFHEQRHDATNPRCVQSPHPHPVLHHQIKQSLKII